jgi:hypothetical protein
MKYVIEFDASLDPQQVEISDATDVVDAVEQALQQVSRQPTPVDIEDESQYEGWQRIEINILPGGYPEDLCDGEPCGTHRDPEDPSLCAVCGELVEP